ncbi:hypothetical protein GGR54DRAFT_648644 [Hypoxylon sp. NC1633]|nr:hypothetical protein GGR54DRAFT_648644 [Hypoxylon sp. NC1633]
MSGPAVKQQRRKAVPKSKVTASQQQTSSSISGFARVSKTVIQTDIKKEEQKISTTTPRKDVTLEAITPGSRKRKVAASVEDDLSADETPTRPSLLPAESAKAVSRTVKRGRGRPSKKARPEPAQKKRARSPSISDSDESAINDGTLFKRLRLESSPFSYSTPLTPETSITDSEADNGLSKPEKTSRLPDDILALIDLHSSLLKTLTLHYAHNGSNVPADLRVLCPSVARAWGKKKVTEADIRICLGVLDLGPNTASQTRDNSPLFTLSNYGRGKICIEVDSKQQASGRPLEENKLNDTFRENITTLWSRFTATNNGTEPTTFTSTLPKAAVTLCGSVTKAAPVLSKGQQRLEELKHGIAIKKQEREALKAAAHPISKSKSNESQPGPDNNDTPMANATAAAPKLSLLDRIRLKSLQKSAAAATNLSPAQLARRAALQRAPDVAALLAMLSRAAAGGGRVSFTMAATLEKLRDSLRGGISRDEGAACVRLLAREVAAEWIGVVTVAGRENVVLETDREVGRAEVERRVRGLLGEGGSE